MNVRRNIVVGSLVVLAVGLSGCGGEKVGGLEEESVVEEAPKEVPVSGEVDFKFHTLIANIPSPLVTYEILKESGTDYNKELSNLLDNRTRYNLESSKAMNFGVYMSDFGYALLNDDNQKALKYYAVAHDIAADLGFGPVLDEVVNERLIANVGNSDSAKVILNDAYKALDKYLRSNDQLKSAGYILTGGWLQTQHIILNVLGESGSGTLNEHLQEEVFKQQMHIGNLISFLIEYQADPDIASLIEQLVAVKGVYDRLSTALDVSGDKMEDLKAAVAAMRAKIIS